MKPIYLARGLAAFGRSDGARRRRHDPPQLLARARGEKGADDVRALHANLRPRRRASEALPDRRRRRISSPASPSLSLSGATFDTLDPATNEKQALVAAGDAADIDRAAKAAAQAFRAWRDVPGAKRRAILHAIADAIEARAEEIALVESSDTGQPIRYMAKAALRGAENFRFYADRAPGAGDGLSLPDADHINYSLRQPIGPVGVITPWNTPFMLSTWKIAPALAAGCTVVHKPAEWSPLSRRHPDRDHGRRNPPPRRPRRRRQSRARPGRERRQGADRTSRDQGRRLRRRDDDRLARSCARARRR